MLTSIYCDAINYIKGPLRTLNCYYHNNHFEHCGDSFRNGTAEKGIEDS